MIYQLADAPDYRFPDVELADTDGLLAVGGDLNPDRLLNAYRHGIFPWYSDEQPILWWSPDPRAILLPEDLKISRSLKKTIRKKLFQVSLDRDFETVIRACAENRGSSDMPGTWITEDMMHAYIELHRLGYAHSVEVWEHNKLVGGLYGIALGKAFFGESMFSRSSDASKTGFITLVQQLSDWGYQLIDCQVESAHLASLGAKPVSRSRFIALLNDALDADDRQPDDKLPNDKQHKWVLEKSELEL